MKKNFVFFMLCLFIVISVNAQNVAINGDGADPNTSAMLDVQSTDKGLLTPRMTLAQRNLISTPATGLLIFQIDNTPGFYYYNGSSWTQLSASQLSQGKIFIGNSSSVAAEQALSGDVTLSETGVTAIGSAKVTNAMLEGSITSDKLAGGITNAQLDGSISNDKLVNGTYMISSTGSSGQVWQSDGSGAGEWANASSGTLSQGKIYIGDASSAPTEQSMMGDVTISETGVTAIGSAKVTNDMLDGSISNDKLAGSITSDKLAGGITNVQLAGSITNDKLAGSISNDKLAGGITNAQLAGSISNDKLAGGITNAQLAGSISNDKLSYGNYMITSAGTNGQFWKSDGSGAGVWANSPTPSQWTTSGSEIYYGNNVGIGLSNPAQRLHVYNGSSGQSSPNSVSQVTVESNGWSGISFLSPSTLGSYILFGDNNDNQIGKIGYTHSTDRMYFGTNGSSSSLVINSSGNVSIGSTADIYKLYVNGTAGGTSGFTNTSDKRFKKDVKPITGGLEKIMKLQGVTFNWDKTVNPELEFDDRNHIGFLAQDIEEVLPQVVTTADDEMQTKSVAYGDVVPVLVEAIKELQKEIEELKKELDNLKESQNK